MQLPHPLARLAGCCWLPRHIAKTRAYFRSEMPFSYRIALGSRIGVDGYFFRHFGLRKVRVLAAIRARPDDAAVADWFLQQPGVTPQQISEWNRFAPLLGTRGHPGYLTRRLVTPFLYPTALRQPVESIFAAIIQDEGLPAELKSD
jgi:hypothetical protein